MIGLFKKNSDDKENFDILEGFLSEILFQNSKIEQILECVSNKDSENDRHNRVDILVKNQLGEFVIIEVQNSKEYDYFHRNTLWFLQSNHTIHQDRSISTTPNILRTSLVNNIPKK